MFKFSIQGLESGSWLFSTWYEIFLRSWKIARTVLLVSKQCSPSMLNSCLADKIRTTIESLVIPGASNEVCAALLSKSLCLAICFSGPEEAFKHPIPGLNFGLNPGENRELPSQSRQLFTSPLLITDPVDTSADVSEFIQTGKSARHSSLVLDLAGSSNQKSFGISSF